MIMYERNVIRTDMGVNAKKRERKSYNRQLLNKDLDGDENVLSPVETMIQKLG